MKNTVIVLTAIARLTIATQAANPWLAQILILQLPGRI